MQLAELEVTKQFQKAVSFADIIEHHGWHLLGRGMEATVAEHPRRDYVLKIWRKGSKYEQFVEFVKQTPSSLHLPRFSRYVRPVPGTNYLYVRMEKLKPINLKQLTDSYGAEILYLYVLGMQKGVRTLVGEPLDFAQGEIWNRGINVSSDTNLVDDLSDVWETFGPPERGWIDVCTELVQFGRDRGIISFDLWEDNFMLRDSTLVISDPFF
jgi:hypothetical protein